jgi:hypothetical protein
MDWQRVLDLRAEKALVPPGKCLYIQSGDPGDFDGELHVVMGEGGWPV